MRVLPDQQHRPARRQPGELVHQRRQGPLALSLRAQCERRVAAAARDRQQGRRSAEHPGDILAPEASRVSSFASFRPELSLAGEAGRALELGDTGWSGLS